MHSHTKEAICIDNELMELLWGDFSLFTMTDFFLHVHFLKTHLSTMAFEQKVTLNKMKDTNYWNETVPLLSTSRRNMFLTT